MAATVKPAALPTHASWVRGRSLALRNLVGVLTIAIVFVPTAALAQPVLEPPPPAAGAEQPRYELAPQYSAPIGIPRPRDEREAYWLYNEHSKSVGGALALEFVLPSGGLFYLGRYGEAGFYWAAMLTGLVMLASDIPFETARSSSNGFMSESGGGGPRFFTGIGLIVFVRFGAMIYAPYAASAYNDALARHLNVPRGFGAADASLRPLTLGEMDPRHSQSALSAVATLPVLGWSF